MGAQKIVILSIFVLFYVISLVSCTEFEAGGENGWIIPQSSNQSDLFNQWASKNRFKVGDTIRKNIFVSSVTYFVIKVMQFLNFILIWCKVSSTRKTLFWWYQKKSTRNARRLNRNFTRTTTIRFSNWTVQVCFISLAVS